MNKKILQLAIPSIISNVTLPLLGLVDTGIMGHMDSEDYIAAVAIGSVIFNIVYWNLAVLRMSTTGLTAQALGRKDDAESISVMARGIGLALVAGAALICLQWPIEQFAFWVIDAKENVTNIARNYYYVRIYAAPAAVANFVFIGWFLGRQKAGTAMILTIVINGINTAGSLFFVYGLGMKEEGVALGTVAGQYAGLVLSVVIFLSHMPGWAKYYKARLVWKLTAMRQYFLVNGALVIRTLTLSLAFAFFKVQYTDDNITIASMNNILLEIAMFMAFAVDGFAFAAESLAGKYFGARDLVNLKRCVKLNMAWGHGLAFCFSIAFLIWGLDLVAIITDKEDVINASPEFLFWIAILPLASTAAFIFDGVYIGTTATRALVISMLVSTFGLFLPLYFILEPIMGNHGLWLAFMIFMVARAVTLWIAYPRAVLGKIQDSKSTQPTYSRAFSG